MYSIPCTWSIYPKSSIPLSDFRVLSADLAFNVKGIDEMLSQDKLTREAELASNQTDGLEFIHNFALEFH